MANQSYSDSPNLYIAQLRVYIAGILMPCMEVEINNGFETPPTASISLPAYPELLSMGMMDRVPVHIFMRESVVEAQEFILLFEGFIESRQYSNSAMNRSITVTAVAYLDFLNDVQLKFMTTLNDMFQRSGAGNADTSLAVFAPGITGFPGFLFHKGLTGGSGGGEQQEGSEEKKELIRFPSDYLENVYSYVQKGGGENPPLKTEHNSALAKFYADYAKMLKLLDRYERLPYFDGDGIDGGCWKIAGYDDQERATAFPMVYGMQAASAVSMLVGGAQQAAQKQSLREVLTFLVNEMEYEFSFIGTPAYHSAGKDSKGEEKSAKLVSSCLKPLLSDSMPPQCNVVHRPLVSTISMTNAFKGMPTRIQISNMHGPLMLLGGAYNDSISSQLAQIGSLDYYPSSKFPGFQRDPNSLEGREMGCELLESETFTGPWVYQCGTPRWFSYIQHVMDKDGEYAMPTIKGENGEANAETVFKERFCRRQLLNAQLLGRQLNATMAFNPYITPGFPGVIYDSADTRFAFAGHVTSVSHTISPTDVRTTVTMAFARLLNEAATFEIPNPVTAVHNITHNESRMTEVYQMLLGSPGSTIPGGKAVTYTTLLENLVTTDTSETSPNNNPLAAYSYSRRNICTFEDYLAFMSLGKIEGNGPEGPKTPLKLTGDFVEQRRPIITFMGRTGESDSLMSMFESIAPSKAEGAKAEKKEEGKDEKKDEKKEGGADAQKDQQGGDKPSGDSAQSGQAAKPEQKQPTADSKKNDGTTLSYSNNLRDMLEKIAQIEFSNMIYS